MKTLLRIVVFSGIFALLIACSDEIPQLNQLSDNDVIVAFGDSLTFGTGTSNTQSYPARLQALTGKTVINAGVPGEVSSNGLERLPAVLANTSAKLVILCHGGNDLLRRQDIQQLEQNLEQMIKLIEDSGAQVVLVAVPRPNLTLEVPDLYQKLASQYRLPIESEIIAKIERTTDLKSDQIHPNAQGYTLIAEQIYRLLQASKAL